MAKYLRYIAHDFTDGDTRPDPQLWTAARAASETGHLTWMYEHYATPTRTYGVAKVNVFFTAVELNREPSEVLSTASVYERFDIRQLQVHAPRKRQEYFLNRLHAGLLRCAAHFHWDQQPFMDAFQRILDEQFEFTFFWKKPLTSPDRRTKVQAFVEASPVPARLYLVFFDRQLSELRRTLLSVGVDGPGVVESALGEIRWRNPQTVEVRHKNGRDYWLSNTDGQVEFHYPRAECGDPHGCYDLGRMYYEGRLVLQDRNRGLKLIQQAATRGYPHAVHFLAQLEAQADSPE